MKNNVFDCQGDSKDLLDIFYELLMTGNDVSYSDVLAKYDGGKLSVAKNNLHPLYQKLKKLVPEVVETLQKYGYTILQEKKQSTTYKYIGVDKDPLKNIRFKSRLARLYEDFDKSIKNKCPVKVVYKPFDKGEMVIIFHPHLLYKFNERLFVFGVSELAGKKPFRKFCMALDRIKGEIKGCNAAYIPVKTDEYNYLVNIVGVRLEFGAELTTIRLRSYDIYTFGRIITKPLHNSQKVVIEPDTQIGKEFGEVEITVIPNIELIGQILSYGSKLRVVSPDSFKKRIVNELKNMIDNYTNT